MAIMKDLAALEVVRVMPHKEGIESPYWMNRRAELLANLMASCNHSSTPCRTEVEISMRLPKWTGKSAALN